MNTRISILGLGWFGSKLAEKLSGSYLVMGSTRSLEKKKAFLTKGIKAEILSPEEKLPLDLFKADIIVINIPPFINQMEWFKSWPIEKKTHVIFISSTSVYGEIEGTVDEKTPTQPDTGNAKYLLEEEKWIATFENYTIIRFGGLIGADRHPGKYLSGRKDIQGGNQSVNLIHLDDAVGFTQVVIEKKLISETFNLVHAEHPSRETYYRNYCKANNLPLPEFILGASEGKRISNSKAMLHYPVSELKT
jgi:nucleoside-diphosphate-sugar epimerase